MTHYASLVTHHFKRLGDKVSRYEKAIRPTDNEPIIGTSEQVLNLRFDFRGVLPLTVHRACVNEVKSVQGKTGHLGEALP